MNMNISCRIANANTQCGQITNPPERVTEATHLRNSINKFFAKYGKWCFKYD